MKQTISLTKTLCFITLLIIVSLASCHRNARNVEKDIEPTTNNLEQKKITGTFKSKLISSFCAYNIVQIQDSAFYNYGMEWTDTQGKTYRHVFAVKNHCDFSTANLKIGEIFNCKIIEKPTIESCSVCMGFMEAPSLQQYIMVVR